jgi:hypothetical protein
MSANTMLREYPRHEEFLYHLKQMIRIIPVGPGTSELEEDVAGFARHLSFALTFLNKLRSTLRKIKISRKGE